VSRPPQQSVPLEQFLAGLPEDASAQARAAAAEIDALEREIGPPKWIERHLIPLSIGALVLFGVGLATFAGLLGGLRELIGLGGIVLLLAAFPAVMLAYLLAVRGHTRIDDAKMALNQAHFLPHGGAYFGAPSGGGRVLLVERRKDEEPDLRAKVHAQYEAATKRRWW